jgi:hypothetical protein
MTLLWLGPDLPAASQLSASSKARKDGERGKRYGALKRDDGINLNFDKDWMKGVKLVSKRLVDLEYYTKLGQTVPMLARYLEGHGVTLKILCREDALLEFDTDQRFVFSGGGCNAIIQKMFEQCNHTTISTYSGRQKRRSRRLRLKEQSVVSKLASLMVSCTISPLQMSSGLCRF